MNAILIKIDRLSNNMDMGLLSLTESRIQLRSLRSDVADRFEQDSDNFNMCISALIDVNSQLDELFDIYN